MHDYDTQNELRQLRREVSDLRERRPGSLITRQKPSADVKLPEGEHQYMVLQMVSDNQVGYDFVRAHPIVSG